MVGLIVGFPVFILTQYLNLETSNLSQGSHLLIMLVPYMALYYGFSIIKIHEEIGLDLQWNNFHKSGDNFPNITIFNVFEMMLVDIILYMMLNCYIEAINPGQYGIRKPVLFPVYSVIKFVRKVFLKWKSPMELEPLHMGNVEEGRLLKKSIELYNINKKYGNKSVVHDLTLDIYQDQITVLLGHNGAGKTTTMLMMTGMIGATSGNIKINEKNIKTNMDELRKDIGLCTQHNLLFTDLTVGEHLGFIARLKGRTSKEAKEEIEFLLSKFNLINKKNELPRTLSGGMKRRLSLAMAIIGGSKILILDEPSSGLDPETRRIVWDLLLSLRAGKTILITTHSMEEADVLGDWIAIMAKGTLQCYGTPMYLKKKYNTGYHLTLVAVNGATQNDLNNIKANVVSQISKAQFKNLDGKNMTFVLPFGDNMMIAKLLSSLEDKKAELKIENISITVTTLEEVFLKTKGDIGTENENNIAMDFEDTESIIHNRKKLLILKIAALMKRNLQLYRRKLWTFMLMIFIGIIIFLFPLYIYLRKGNDLEEKEIKFDLHIYNESLAFYSGAQDGMIEKMKKFYKQAVEKYGGTAKKVVDVQQAIIDKGVENITYYMNHMVISAEFNSTDKTAIVTAFYNRDLKHSTPISLNLVTNAIAMAYLGEDYSISGSNWPLEDASNSTGLREKNMVILVNVAMMIPMGCFFILGSFIMFAQSERSTKFIQLQYLCGLKPYCYLMANLFTDLMVYVIIALILSVSMLLWAFINGLELWIIFVILFMYGLAGMPFVYLFSRMKSSFTSFQYFLYCSICLGIVLAIIFMLTKPHLEEDDYCSLKKFYRCKTIFMIFLPQFGLSYLIVTFFSKVLKNFETGYEKEDHWLYLEKDLNLMLASFFLYFVINILLDSYILKRFSHFARYGPVTSGSSDPHDVNPTNPHNLLTVKDLCKRYGRAKIVKNVSFSLKDGECLGILGVNGAGKTTIFHMLTREEIRNQGTIQIDDNGRVIDINQDEYLEKLGYCPQVDPLNYDLSARQILNLFARLRGASNPKIVNMFLKIFALEKYADLPCGHYSGGNKRKLSLGMALIGFPKCILLDEPTCGVDPFAKRNIWNLIKKVQESKNLSFILTSHSMAECEALCNNLIIMKNGIFEKQGTINNLKREYGGFSIKLKLVTKSDDEGGSMPSTVNKNSQKFNTVDELKQYFVKNYGAEIKDEHYSFLDLCIRDKSRKWSTIFKEVELIKSQNTHLIEDYVISEASLEDIFLSVARS